MQLRHIVRTATAAVVLSACASTGFPAAGDPGAAIPNAEQLIAAAQAAGAEQYAPEPLASARANLEAARVDQRDQKTDQAALKARQAVADATYARAAAERAKAERAKADAAAALNALPGGGR
jgi:Domain of unknown function (DUF4398)